MSKYQVGDRVLVRRPNSTIHEPMTIEKVGWSFAFDTTEYKSGKRIFTKSEIYVPPVTESKPFTRETVLTTAEQLINGDRAKDYGDASENFQRIADLWKPILGTEVTASDVALCLTQLKVARLITSPAHRDSWVDACGYLALGGEIALKEQSNGR